MEGTTIVAGPVSRAQFGDLVWPGTKSVYVPCTGDGDPSCAEQAATRTIDRLAPSGDVILAAFSAGGQWVKRQLPNPRVRAVYLADATYTEWGPDNRPQVYQPPTSALVDYVVQAAKDPKSARALFTASSAPNKTLPSGAATLAEIARAAAQRGVSWTQRESAVELAEGITLEGALVWSSGGALLIDMGRGITHEQHATELARKLWPIFTNATAPTTSGASKSSTSSARGLAYAGVLGGLALVGLGVAGLAHKAQVQE